MTTLTPNVLELMHLTAQKLLQELKHAEDFMSDEWLVLFNKFIILSTNVCRATQHVIPPQENNITQDALRHLLLILKRTRNAIPEKSQSNLVLLREDLEDNLIRWIIQVIPDIRRQQREFVSGLNQKSENSSPILIA
jgi:hypothetical protein